VFLKNNLQDIIMKKIISFFVVSCFLLAGTASETYKIKGMHCQYGCINKIKTLMGELDGMGKCEVDFDKSLMTVEYDDTKVNQDIILSTLTEKTTFETRKVDDKVEKKSFWSKLKGIFS